MKNIILDTNFLLIPFQFKVDILRQIEEKLGPISCRVVAPTIKELNKIVMNEKGKDKDAAKFGLDMVEKLKITVVDSETDYADDAIFQEAVKTDCIVATQDKELKQKLHKHGIGTVTMRKMQDVLYEDPGKL